MKCPLYDGERVQLFIAVRVCVAPEVVGIGGGVPGGPDGASGPVGGTIGSVGRGN